MRIGLLLPSTLTSPTDENPRIFAPLPLAIAIADGLVSKGHEVFFYSSHSVQTRAKIIPGNDRLIDKTIIYERAKNVNESAKKFRTNEVIRMDFENQLTMQAYTDLRDGKVDIIHSFHDFSAHYFDEVTKLPTVYTLHDPLPQTDNTIEYERLKLFTHHNFVSISMSQRKSIVPLHFVANIYHGIDLTHYPYEDSLSDELIFIGRLVPDKGADIAIHIAIETNKKLSIASSDNYMHSPYYKEAIQPYKDEGKIDLFGFFPNDEQKRSGCFYCA